MLCRDHGATRCPALRLPEPYEGGPASSWPRSRRDESSGGSPSLWDFGMTVTPDGQHIRVDDTPTTEPYGAPSPPAEAGSD